MRRSKIAVYIHFVWATKNREWLLEDPEIERRIYRNLQSQAEKLKCEVLAINGMPDHVHVLIALHPTISLSEFAKQLKATASQFANEKLNFQGAFDWQDGYGAFSVSKSHLTKVTNYVLNQPHHHATGDLWPALEQTDDQL